MVYPKGNKVHWQSAAERMGSLVAGRGAGRTAAGRHKQDIAALRREVAGRATCTWE